MKNIKGFGQINESEGEELFFTINDETVVRLANRNGQWHEYHVSGPEPYGFGSKTYDGSLDAEDILSWLSKDYGDVEAYDENEDDDDDYEDSEQQEDDAEEERQFNAEAGNEGLKHIKTFGSKLLNEASSEEQNKKPLKVSKDHWVSADQTAVKKIIWDILKPGMDKGGSQAIIDSRDIMVAAKAVVEYFEKKKA